ncbi:Type I restriction modification DNA specificity domain protein [compost metagenome]
MGDVCTLERRQAPFDAVVSSKHPYVGMENVSGIDGSISVGDGSRTGNGKSTVFRFTDEHVLFGKLRPYLRKIAAPEFSGGCSTELVPLRPDSERLDRKYLYHWLRRDALISHLMGKNTGARMPRADMNVLLAQEISLPRLEEQRRIVALLDRAAEIKRRAEAARDKARAIIPALFVGMFGDPATNSKAWDVVELGSVADVSSGITKGRKLKDSVVVAAPYMRVANVQDGRLDLSEIKTIDAVDQDFERYRLEEGDLLMTEGGDPDKLGRCAIWNNEIEGCLHQNHVFRVRVNRAQLLPAYAATLFGSAYGKSYFLKVAKRTTGIASINKTQLSAFPMLVPPIALQLEFERLAHSSSKLENLIKSAEHKASNTQSALSAEVFA